MFTINNNLGSGRQGSENILNVISIMLIAIVFVVQIFSKVKAGFDDYGLTEWLINYSGGFIRRGLPGSFIYFLFASHQYLAKYFVIAVSIILYVSFLFYFILSTRKLFPVYLTLSPVLMGAPVYSDFWMRKDVLGLYFLVLALVLSISKRRTYLRVILVNLVLIVSLFSHEAFAFYGLPAVLIINVLVLLPISGTIKRALFKSGILLLPAFVAFLLVIIFRGNRAIALKIHNSWRELWILTDSNSNYLSGPNGSIGCLQRSAWQELSISAKELNAFSHGIYVPLALSVTVCICFIALLKLIFSCNRNYHEKSMMQLSATFVVIKKRLFFYVLVFQFVFISPLFILAIDYGRWIFFWTVSSVIIFRMLTEHFKQINLVFPGNTADLIVSQTQKFPFNKWILLFLGLPISGWSVNHFVFSSPLGSVFKILIFGN
jgi:hypothetical protein